MESYGIRGVTGVHVLNRKDTQVSLTSSRFILVTGTLCWAKLDDLMILQRSTNAIGSIISGMLSLVHRNKSHAV